MKKNLLFLLLTFITLGFIGCKDDNDDGGESGSIQITWAANPDFDTVEIVQDMTGKAVINIKADAGIKALNLNIASAALTDEILSVVGLKTTVDLVNVDLSEYETVLKGLPYGDQVKNKKEVVFDVSSLVPMIIILPNAAGDHVFTVTVVDNNGKSEKRDLIFHYTKPANLSVSGIDLWKNTAIITATDLPDGALVQYREKDAEAWQTVEGNDAGTYMIQPVWKESTNAAGLKIYTPEENTGIWAGKTYEYRIMDGENEIFSKTFDTEAGDVIPNGDMSGWSKIGTEKKPLPYPNASGDTLWTSGNNAYNYPLFGDGDPVFLCEEDNGTAKLQATSVLGAVFAAGNLFTGTFVQAGTAGVASFGQPYTWKARPKALCLKIKATVGNMDFFGDIDPDKESLESQKPIDKARIFAVVTEWNSRHAVMSGLGVKQEELNGWDPATQVSTKEGAIIGYASKFIEENVADMQTIEIPFEWYDKVTKPGNEKFSLVISFATSYRGDYLTGCSTNKLWVDDVEWVY